MNATPPTSRPIPTVRIGTPALVAVVLTLSIPVGIATAVVSCPGSSHDDTRPDTVTGRIDRVVVDGGGGNLTISADGQADTAQITADLHWRGAKELNPTVQTTLDNGTLHLTYACADTHGVEGNCAVGWTVRVPRGAALTADLTDGNATVKGFTQAVTVTTTSGNIDVANGGDGDPVLKTATGDITAVFTGRPTTITAVTRDGDVEIATDGSPYYDEVDTAYGNRHLTNERADRSAARTVRVTSDTGNVTITNHS